MHTHTHTKFIIDNIERVNIWKAKHKDTKFNRLDGGRDRVK